MHSLIEQYLNYEYVTTPEALEVLVERMRSTFEPAEGDSAPGIALDIETTELDSAKGCVRLIQVGFGGAADPVKEDEPPDQYVVDCFRVDVAPLIAALDDAPHLVIQNAAFETEWLGFHYGWEFDLSRIFDTCIASWALDERPAKLGSILLRRLGLAMSKEQQVSNWGAETLNEEQLKYAALDVAVLPLLEKGMQLDLEARSAYHNYEDEFRDWIGKGRARHEISANEHKRDETKLKDKIASVLGKASSREELEKWYILTRQRTLRHEYREELRRVYEYRLATL